MVDFKTLKKNSKNNLSDLASKLSSLNQPFVKEEDNRFWKLTVDKAGNGYATIRWIRQVADEDLPFVRFWDHAFKGPGGKWYIELSRTSLKNPTTGKSEADPVSEHNTSRWAEGEKSPGRAFVSGGPGVPGAKRRLHYISNIYVVDDPANASNNGKVFLFKYGAKIFDKLNDAMNPKVAVKKAMNPFDFWEGANFNLIATNKAGYRNYDDSAFIAPGPLADDETMKAIWDTAHPLLPFVNPAIFKSYNELKTQLDLVLSGATGKKTLEDEIPQKASPAKAAPEAPAKAEESAPWETDDADDDLEAFRKLANS